MPKPFPADFRRDVIAVARKGEASVSQVARDFGISESCLQRWLKIADRDDGLAPSSAGDRGGGRRGSDGETVLAVGDLEPPGQTGLRTPKLQATCAIDWSPCRATAITSARNSLGNGLARC